MADSSSNSICKTKYWHKIDASDKNSRVQCDLCPRFCQIPEGHRGLCYIRANEQQQIVMTSYGRSSGFAVDPIEKKPLNHFYPGSSIYSFGTAGCNLTCKFCQNWDISKSRQMDKLMSHASPEQIAVNAKARNCSSVAYTYNDPIIFHEYAIDVAAACREQGLKSVAVTAGYICPEPRQEFFAQMDAVNIDLKAFSENFYQKMTGSHLHNVLETIEYIHHETKNWMELTTLLIPDLNDSDQEIHDMCDWIIDHIGADVPIHFSAFHPTYKLTDKPGTPLATLLRARKIALDAGLHYVYTGNVHHSESASTWCHQCGHLLIERDWYQLGEFGLTPDGQCLNCGTICSGHFSL
ncbi:MAG: AmmeMemoRadiSam system radical SAM enzyme [Gammaproteobacteria bacterium]|nr:AmmeMemoRadiSam system radical SAM enzyme [Gammaproteobacteria bacterium]